MGAALPGQMDTWSFNIFVCFLGPARFLGILLLQFCSSDPTVSPTHVSSSSQRKDMELSRPWRMFSWLIVTFLRFHPAGNIMDKWEEEQGIKQSHLHRIDGYGSWQFGSSSSDKIAGRITCQCLLLQCWVRTEFPLVTTHTSAQP